MNPKMMGSPTVRLGACVRRNIERAANWAVKRLPYFPDALATCPAHGTRYCVACSRNPGDCMHNLGSCGYWSATGMHWDTCRNRVRK